MPSTLLSELSQCWLLGPFMCKIAAYLQRELHFPILEFFFPLFEEKTVNLFVVYMLFWMLIDHCSHILGGTNIVSFE